MTKVESCYQNKSDIWHQWNVQIWSLKIISWSEKVFFFLICSSECILIIFGSLSTFPLFLFDQYWEQYYLKFLKDVRICDIKVNLHVIKAAEWQVSRIFLILLFHLAHGIVSHHVCSHWVHSTTVFIWILLSTYYISCYLRNHLAERIVYLPLIIDFLILIVHFKIKNNKI